MAVRGSTDRERRLGVTLVVVQVVLLVAIVVAPGGGLWPHGGTVTAIGVLLVVVGLVVAVAGASGLGTSLTPMPTPSASSQLRTGGLYRYVRHPIYAGLLLASLGEVVRSASGWKVAAFLALFALFTVKARFEERLLAERYPEYASYAAHTPRFVPYFSGRPPTRVRQP